MLKIGIFGASCGNIQAITNARVDKIILEGKNACFNDS